MPCVLKPLMSSSGKGQSVIRKEGDQAPAWAYSQEGGRAGAGRCIVEGFIAFDFEITCLTVSAVNGLQCCPPIGHLQIEGDYRESWQPMPMSERAWARSQEIAKMVVEALGGHGLFGVELFIQGDEVLFSEVSPRPHDTGLVTLASQNLSEFALHVRAILGFPIPEIRLLRPAASVPLLGQGTGTPRYFGLEAALAIPESQLRLFGKPSCEGHRRLAVVLAAGDTIEVARARADQIAHCLRIELDA
jgi:phosphoribosylglycinamide formyltransferase 2